MALRTFSKFVFRHHLKPNLRFVSTQIAPKEEVKLEGKLSNFKIRF